MADMDQKGEKNPEDRRAEDDSSPTTPGDPDEPKGQDAHADIQGNTIGDYRIIRKIGDGAMGVVFEAEQISLRRKVALKVLPFGQGYNEKAVKRFQREAEAGGRQRHPGIVTVYAVGEDKNVHYIAMELVDDGLTLRHKIEELKKHGHPPHPYYIEATEITAEVAEALHHAHEQGVIHRDIKPGNILLTREGRPMITDFGLAKLDDAATLTEKGMTPGTPGYMSPEQAQGLKLDRRTDVYSLGATLYELLTFERPFKGQGIFDFLNAVIYKDPQDPCQVNSRIPRSLSDICLKSLTKEPEDRYRSAEEMAEALHACAKDLKITPSIPVNERRKPQKSAKALDETEAAEIMESKDGEEASGNDLDQIYRKFLMGVESAVATLSPEKSDSYPIESAQSSESDHFQSESKKEQDWKALETPNVLGDFKILHEIGRGGLSTTFEAEQLSLQRRVALEVITTHLSGNSDAVARFKRSGEALSRLNHPGIVTVHGMGEQNGIHYIAYELIEGRFSLVNVLEKVRASGQTASYFQETAQFFAAVCDALDYIHQAGIIHRDIKPFNILVTPQGVPKVTDFQLARIEDALPLSCTGDFVGTPYYMSPEQAMARRVGIDHRTDIYSLGVTLYELICLQRPFTGETTYEVLKKIVMKKPTNPRKIYRKVPRKLAAITLKAMEKEPSARYQYMAALAKDLRSFLDAPTSRWLPWKK